MPVRRIADRVQRNQLERRLTHQVGGHRQPVGSRGSVERIEMRIAERDSTCLRCHQHLRHVRVARPPFDFARCLLGCLRADADRPAPATVRVVPVQPDVGEPVVVSGLQHVLGLRQLRIAHRLQRGNADSGVDEQLFGGIVGIGTGEATAGRSGVDTHRHGLVRVRRVVEVRHRGDGVSGRPDLVHPFGGRVGLEHVGRDGHRVHIGVDDGHRDLGLRLDSFDRRHTVVPSTGAVSPYNSLALRHNTLSRCELSNPAAASAGEDVDQCG